MAIISSNKAYYVSLWYGHPEKGGREVTDTVTGKQSRPRIHLNHQPDGVAIGDEPVVFTKNAKAKATVDHIVLNDEPFGGSEFVGCCPICPEYVELGSDLRIQPGDLRAW